MYTVNLKAVAIAAATQVIVITKTMPAVQPRNKSNRNNRKISPKNETLLPLRYIKLDEGMQSDFGGSN